MTARRDELVVLLGDDGQPIGTAPKAAVHHSETPLHLAFSCYVFDPAGRFLLTRRALAKKTWPGVWTNSCCGHPAPGEPVEEAVQRRVRQELGTELTGIRLLLPDFRYRAVMDDGTVENELCPVYAATCPDPRALVPDPAEVAEVKWVDWDAFRRDVLVSGRDVSPWCGLQVAALDEDPRSPEHGVA
ncbi:MAG: isopentenyl-diphosphate Delta-isomerase [Knoellia sp.]